MSKQQNFHHFNALRIGKFGILLGGMSGVGKSALTLALIERASFTHQSGILVSDDYVFLERLDDRIYATAPTQIAGLVEVRGAGLFRIDYQKKVRIDIVFQLGTLYLRFPEDKKIDLLGVKTPLYDIPQVKDADLLTLCHMIEAILFKKKIENK